MYRVIRSVLIFSLVAVFVGCEYWNKDMLGYLEYWSETVQMGKVEVSDATIQKNDAGADTIPVAATPTIAAYVINPQSYELLAEIGDSSSADKSVRVSDSAVQSKAQVVAHEPTLLKVQLGPADGSLEHTEFRVDFEAIRKDTMQSSGKVIGVTLRYNTPPVAPTPVVWNYDSSQYEVVKAGEKWEADRDGILYWAYDDSIVDETDPNCAKWFSIGGTRHLVADCKVKPNVQVDGLSVFQFNTNYGGTSVAAVDSEGISSPAIASGQAVPPAMYVIKYDANGADGGTAPASQNKTQYTDITLATNSGGLTRIGYRFTGWNTAPDGTGTPYSAGATYSADKSVTLYAQWEYQLRDSVQVLAGYSSPNHTDGTWKYVEFGYWPQTVKAADVTVDKSKSKSMGMFTYYLGSDGNWYVEAKENALGNGIEYRYSNEEQAGQGGTTTKWFKVEPIVWRVLTENYIDADGKSTGNALLLAEKILTGSIPYSVDRNTRTITGAGTKQGEPDTVYPNNWQYSTIRAWLNGLDVVKSDDAQDNDTTYDGKGFLQTAFTTNAQNLIAETEVDNSAASTNPASNDKHWNSGMNEYACGNTTDKVFLLSEAEATTGVYLKGITDEDYGFSDYGEGSTRIRVTTDYAKATGAYQDSTDGYGGWWWLRSPRFGSYGLYAHVIDNDGHATLYKRFDYTEGGVVPALCIPAKQLLP